MALSNLQLGDFKFGNIVKQYLCLVDIDRKIFLYVKGKNFGSCVPYSNLQSSIQEARTSPLQQDALSSSKGIHTEKVSTVNCSGKSDF